MGKQEVLEFLKHNPEMWFDIKSIKQRVPLSPLSTIRGVLHLREEQLIEYRIIKFWNGYNFGSKFEYRLRLMENEKQENCICNTEHKWND